MLNDGLAWSTLSKALLLLLCAVLTYSLFNSRSLPPGPKSWPLLGNILSISIDSPWYSLTKLRDKFGPLVYLHGLGSGVLVLNTLEDINALLEKKGDIYSHRPRFTVVGDLMELGQSMPLLPYGKEWREHRKLAHIALSPSAVKKYYGVQEEIAALMNQQFLDDPSNFFQHVRLAAGRVVLAVTYGINVESSDDSYITHAEETMAVIGKSTVPGAFLCDLVPILKYCPSWVPFQRKAAVGRAMIWKLVSDPFELVARQLTDGSCAPSLVAHLLGLEDRRQPEYEHRVRWTAGAMYGAGAETTYSTVLTFMLAMTHFPEVQRRAQAELDAVLGDRLPKISDAPNLPYVAALIKETMRWHPALPLSIARRTARLSVYKGYTIPANTIVVPNVWAVAFERHGKHDPRDFVPERFLEPDNLTPDPGAWAFGFGRRICPGKFLAENSVFILIAGILAAFNVSPTKDGPPPLRFGPSLVSYPEEFACTVEPRSQDHADRIRRRASQFSS